MAKVLSIEGVSGDVVAGSDALAAAFAGARPFRHLVIDGFLDAAFAEALLAQFPAFEQADNRGEDGRPGAKATLERIRGLGDAYARLDELVRSAAFLRLLGELCGIDDLRYDPWYLGGGTHENRNGASLEPHVDFSVHPLERWERRINLILYLNHDWDPGWGGNLCLYEDPRRDGTPAVSVAPAFNRCVVFETTDRSWHGFDRIAAPSPGASRRSIALYFYTPLRKDAPRRAHSTVYVGRPLPPHLRRGHTLDDADLAALQALLADRDGRIRQQYADISSLMERLRAHERGLGGLLMHHGRRLLARLRRAGR